MLEQVEKEFLRRLAHLYDAGEIKEMFLWVAEALLGKSRSEVLMNKNMGVCDADLQRFQLLLQKLEKGEPLQYALGYAWFYGIRLKVNSAVLIPRPETEELVARIVSEHRGSSPKILDIGTGSGCIPIALKKSLPRAAVWAMDISREALKVAKENAIAAGCDVSFIEGDILHPSSFFLPHFFDIIVSNPPYIPPVEKSAMGSHVLNHEPHLALFVPEEKPLLFYESIAHFALQKLNTSGTLYFEINRRFGKEVQALLRELGFVDVDIQQDMHNADRIVTATKR